MSNTRAEQEQIMNNIPEERLKEWGRVIITHP